ncbi:MAG: hypothetical protein GY832_43365 [Chloroflexi bacterium]|nr:hypothetical protein [Chloroflexota bacterium]
MRTYVYAPLDADPTKMKKIRVLGGEVRLHGWPGRYARIASAKWRW